MAREEARYRDGLGRLPRDPDARQRQLVRVAMAAGGAGLARLMQGNAAEAAEWQVRSADRYRESFGAAPPGSWGRLIGALKARVLAGDWERTRQDARWILRCEPAAGDSPIGTYAAVLAMLVLEDDEEALRLAVSLVDQPPEAFPRPVADALVALGRRDPGAYARAAAAVLESFETRDAYLEDLPVADTVIVLEALAARRGIAADLRSPLLPR